MSQSPAVPDDFEYDSPYADAARQLNKLVRSGRSYSGHERNCCYLNLDGKQFANTSQVSGFDFAEDGRAVAIVDWDGDGDQDFWVSNRTAPQLRLMQNRIANQAKANYVAFRLRGTASNRDAVGARVSVTLRDAPQATLLKTVRGGEGFLSTGSKTVHFGLGQNTTSTVQVRWPRGLREQFHIADVNRTYELVEGSGQSRQLDVPRHDLQPTPVPEREQSLATHNWLTEPAPSPPLLYFDTNGQTVDAAVESGYPTIVILWASWCQPCLAELAEWSAEHESFASQNVRLLALCTDGVSDTPRSKSQDFLRSINFRGEAADATPQLLDCLQHFHNAIYDHHRPLPMPTTILLDGQGNIRAFYKGTVPAAKLMADVARLEQNDASLPFPGKWLAPQIPHKLHLLAEAMYRDGYATEATAFVERLRGTPRMESMQVKARLFLAREQSTSNKVESLRQLFAILEVQPKNPAAHEQMGLLLARAGRQREALHHFGLAMQHSPSPTTRTRYNYARSLRMNGQVDPAIEQLQLVLESNPKLAPAWEQLGLTRASHGDFQQAMEAFAKAAMLEPDEVRHAVNLAMAHNGLGNFQLAWDRIRPVVQGSSPPKPALLTAAKSLMGLQRKAAAAEILERFLKLEPDATAIREELRRLRQP